MNDNKKSTRAKSLASMDKRIESGDIVNQKIWRYIEELNSVDDERLDRVALVDYKQRYTYREMFREWRRYARVFSALQMTDETHARVAIATPAPFMALVHAMYALNMTGASLSMLYISELMNSDQFALTVQKEKITDLIISHAVLPPELLKSILRQKEKMGLRHVIVVNTPVYSGEYPAPLTAICDINYRTLKSIQGVLNMDDLFDKYEASPIHYGADAIEKTAVILHTSGTTSGIHKPVPLSDSAFNEGTGRFLRDPRFAEYKKGVTLTFMMSMASAYSTVDMLHLGLSFGARVVVTAMSMASSGMPKLCDKFGVNVITAGAAPINGWINDQAYADLSSVKLAVMGGTTQTEEIRLKSDEYFRKCGAVISTMNGYGLTETAGACILSEDGSNDNAIGRPLSGVKVKIYNEEEDRFYDLSDGPRTGVLFLSTPSMTGGRIDGEEYISFTEIEGEKYLNTYDLVRVNENGSMACIGRMNKYFVANDGVCFDVGLIEAAVSEEPGVEACGIAPVYDKTLHDTIPVLYLQTSMRGEDGLRQARQVLGNVFIRDGLIAKTNLPGQCVVASRLPYNAMGKVDVYAIAADSENIGGTRYKVTPVWQNNSLTDLRLDVACETAGLTENNTWSGTPKELENGTQNYPLAVKNLISQVIQQNMPFSPNWMEAMADSQVIKDWKNLFENMTQMLPQPNWNGYMPQQPSWNGYMPQQPGWNGYMPQLNSMVPQLFQWISGMTHKQ